MEVIQYEKIFENKPYRVTFKNGLSGEYDGQVLATSFPFDPEQVEGIALVHAAPVAPVAPAEEEVKA